jgi:hypothetical protein
MSRRRGISVAITLEAHMTILRRTIAGIVLLGVAFLAITIARAEHTAGPWVQVATAD